MKPISSRRFKAIIPPPKNSNSGRDSDPQEKRRSILYVEDDPQNQVVARQRLQESHDIHLATNAKEACLFLAAKGKDIDVILMDIELQGSDMDGIGLTQLIRGTLNPLKVPEYAKSVPKLDVPIIFVTAYGEKYQENKLIAVGGDLVIRKPVNFVTLKMALTEITLKKNQQKLKQMRDDKP